MMKDASTDVFTGKSFKIITQDGKHGILQSNLWKQLEITGRDGSRLALRLEKQSLIKREKVLEEGRWTCLTCTVERMCSEEGSYSPNNCNLIQDWLLSAVDSLSQQQYHTAPQQQKKTTSRTFSETSKAAGETYFQTSNKIIIKNETFPG
jgi:hypothetical protein